MKDWQTGSGYLDERCNHMRKWAWEFLRRNRSYCQDYTLINSLCEKYDFTNSWDEFAETPAFHDLFICSPPSIEEETESQYHRRMTDSGVKRCKIQNRYNAARDKYSLSGWLPNPASGWDEMMEIGLSFSHWGTVIHTPQCTSIKDASDNEILVRFDLSKPISPQIKSAERYLKARQRGLHGKVIHYRYWLKKFPVYLRILDAMNAGATIEEMVKFIYPTDCNLSPDFSANKKMYKAINRAESLRDGGYIKLLLE